MGQDRKVSRVAGYFGEGDESLFGWYHDCAAAPPRDCVAVICAPFGHEYSSAHRTLRHLADELARRGIPALRFDYHGTGDSPGSDFDPDRLRRWQADIASAAAFARVASARSSVCLVGVRLGATLAAMATAQVPVDLLVLWNPNAHGKHYVRELQAIAMTAEHPAVSLEGELESGGFVITAETLELLRKVDLATTPIRVARRALLLTRDDQSKDAIVGKRLAELGIACDESSAPGWSAMMAEPHYSQVPDAALATIADWVERNTAPQSSIDVDFGAPPRRTAAMRSGAGRATGAIMEEACNFGASSLLFGILSSGEGGHGRTAVLLPNAGAVHHVGPNRIYVTMARNLAALGLACLRFDVAGLGDSVLDEGTENLTYPDWAVPDTVAAMDHLKRRFGYSRFIVMGLCSGAHTAFHAGLGVVEHEVAEVVLINPLTYRWQEGMSLEVSRKFNTAQHYLKSARDPSRWLKAMRGDVDVGSALKAALGHVSTTAKAYLNSIFEAILPSMGTRLSKDLRRLFAMKRQMTLFVSEGDPGAAMLMAGARRTASRALKSGDIKLRYVENADHTFSQHVPRRVLIDQLRAHFGARGGRTLP